MNTTDQIKKKKVRKIEPYTRSWERQADALARSYCPEIRACRECGHPVVSGYCCPTCESTNP